MAMANMMKPPSFQGAARGRGPLSRSHYSCNMTQWLNNTSLKCLWVYDTKKKKQGYLQCRQTWRLFKFPWNSSIYLTIIFPWKPPGISGDLPVAPGFPTCNSWSCSRTLLKAECLGAPGESSNPCLPCRWMINGWLPGLVICYSLLLKMAIEIVDLPWFTY